MSSFTVDPMMQGLVRVLDLRTEQHSLTMSNLANADTPEYSARYIDFESVLGAAMEVGQEGALRRTHELHLAAPGQDFEAPQIEEIEADPSKIDGNSVDREAEMMRLRSNELFYRGVSRGVSKKLAMLKYAASDGGKS